MKSVNSVTIVGHLTRDPELRTAGDTSVCQLGVAVNSSHKDASGQWVDKPNFFDVVVWGRQGEACANHLAKGRQVAVQGRLDYRAWEAQDGSKRSKVEIVAELVQFIGGQEKTGTAPGPRPGRIDPADDFKDIDFGGDDDGIPF